MFVGKLDAGISYQSRERIILWGILFLDGDVHSRVDGQNSNQTLFSSNINPYRTVFIKLVAFSLALYQTQIIILEPT